MESIKTSNLAIAQIIAENPIIYDAQDTKRKYLALLNKYLKMGGWNKRKYESSGMEMYRKIIFGNDEVRQEHTIVFYKYFVLFDVLHVLGYETEKIPASKFDGIAHLPS